MRRLPIPSMFALTFLAGVCLQYVMPLAIDSASVLRISRVAGIVLIVGGVMLAFWSSAARSTLVTGGAYRLTRNPMYVGLTLTYVGVAAIQGQIWPILLLPLLELYVDRIVIPVEEMRLRETFGAAYERYCAGVPRWI